MLWMAAPVWAHGIGGRGDLPVPLSFFVIGAGAAVVVSFVALTLLWSQPRLQNPPPTRAHRRGPVRLLPALRWVGLAGLALVVAAGALDGNQTTRNISPTLVWVYFWLVVPFASAAVGNLWRWMNPWRSLARWLNPDLPERPDIAARLGMWPATLAFLAFTWLEIVSPNGADPRTLALAAVTYTVVLVAATRWLGVESGLRTFDAFGNYHRLLAAISPYRLDAPAPGPGAARVGATIERWGWLRALPSIEPARGLTAFVLVMIGTVTYDGLSGSQWWGDVAGGLRDNVWFGTGALIGMVLL
ncbi:MAG: hypothetical protein HKP18_02615, partial [Acidimicrobiia bacterium]|nr:hypothetical protein [Acidimicrobiia bacterium]